MGGGRAAGQALLGPGTTPPSSLALHSFSHSFASLISGILPFIKYTLPKAPPERAPPALLRVAPAAPGPAMGRGQPRTVVDETFFSSLF